MKTFLLTLAVIAACGCRADESQRPATLRAQCRNNLKQIGMALNQYHKRYGSFPPAFVTDKDGKPAYSWRVLLLPFLDEEKLYAKYRFDEPWDGPNNSKLADQIPAVYRCPGFVHCPENHVDLQIGSKFFSNYVVIRDPASVIPNESPISLDDIVDGPENSIAVVETRKHSVHWMEPIDINEADFCRDVKAAATEKRTNHDHGVQALFANGAVHSLNRNIESAILKGLATRNGNETLGKFRP